jgi:hypothetical protein
VSNLARRLLLATLASALARTLTIVQRDVDVSVPGDSGYVRKTC